MSPAEALKHIFTLLDGAESVANERQQRLLLQAIAELASKGLAAESIPEMQTPVSRPPNFRWQ
jgi:hypothetical protein